MTISLIPARQRARPAALPVRKRWSETICTYRRGRQFLTRSVVTIRSVHDGCTQIDELRRLAGEHVPGELGEGGMMRTLLKLLRLFRTPEMTEAEYRRLATVRADAAPASAPARRWRLAAVPTSRHGGSPR